MPSFNNRKLKNGKMQIVDGVRVSVVRSREAVEAVEVPKAKKPKAKKGK